MTYMKILNVLCTLNSGAGMSKKRPEGRAIRIYPGQLKNIQSILKMTTMNMTPYINELINNKRPQVLLVQNNVLSSLPLNTRISVGYVI